MEIQKVLENLIIFDCEFNSIPKKEWLLEDMVFITYDSQKRLCGADGRSYLVCVMGNGTLSDDIKIVGIFGDRMLAVMFGRCFIMTNRYAYYSGD